MSAANYRKDDHVQQQIRAGKSCFDVYIEDLTTVFGDFYTKSEQQELAIKLHGAVRPGHGRTDTGEDYVD